MKLGGDLFAELKLERAEIFITQKLEVRSLTNYVVLGICKFYLMSAIADQRI